MVVFSLRRWSSYVPSRFLVSRRTLELPMPWIRFAYGDFTLFVLLFQNSSASHPTYNVGVLYPVRIATYGLGSSDFARHYFRNRSFFLFLQVLRCFSSLGSPRKTMDSSYDTTALPVVRSRIRISADQCLCAAPRSFSQLVTSFFGAMYQGILLYALCSLIFFRVSLPFRRIKNSTFLKTLKVLDDMQFIYLLVLTFFVWIKDLFLFTDIFL